MEWAVETLLPREVRKLASAIEEHELTIALLNDDLQERDNRIQAIQYENVSLQAQGDVYQAHLQRCQDQIHEFIINHRANDSGKDNIVMSSGKTPRLKKMSFMSIPTILRGRIQRRFINTKRRWFRAQYPHHRFIVEVSWITQIVTSLKKKVM